jgi:hypothetical protein
MKAALIYQMMQTLEAEMFDTEDLKNLSFYAGAFYVFADQAKKGNLDEEALHDYLSDFLSEKIRADILEEKTPEIFAELQNLLENFGYAKAQAEAKNAATLLSEDSFSDRDRREIELLLTAWNEDKLPELFSRKNIRLARSENFTLFLTNAENQIVRVTEDEEVKLWYYQPQV